MHTPKDPMCAVSNPHLSSAAGFGTTFSQVAGFHRAVPSTTLDKACMQLFVDYNRIFPFVKSSDLIVHNSDIDFLRKS